MPGVPKGPPMSMGGNRVRTSSERDPAQRIKASHKLPEGLQQPFWEAHPSDGYGSSFRKARTDETKPLSARPNDSSRRDNFRFARYPFRI